jgi:hypothetical protein
MGYQIQALCGSCMNDYNSRPDRLYIYLTDRVAQLVIGFQRFPKHELAPDQRLFATSWWNFKPTMTVHPHPPYAGDAKKLPPSDLKWRLSVRPITFPDDYAGYYLREYGIGGKDLVKLRAGVFKRENARLTDTYVSLHPVTLDDLLFMDKWNGSRKCWEETHDFQQMKQNMEFASQFFTFE